MLRECQEEEKEVFCQDDSLSGDLSWVDLSRHIPMLPSLEAVKMCEELVVIVLIVELCAFI